MGATTHVAVVLFDFGGVLAEEGFRAGLKAIAHQHGFDPERFFQRARELVYETGYVTGGAGEHNFWTALRRDFPLESNDEALRAQILDRFALRPALLDAVDRLRAAGVQCAILSDQTDWLERLDQAQGFYRRFDHIYNSYRLGLDKQSGTVFDAVIADLKLPPDQILFLDDGTGNVERARARGLLARQCASAEACLRCLEDVIAT